MQVIPALGAGGAEQGCIDVCAALKQAGAEAFVVSSGGPRMHEIIRAGGTHIEMPVHSKNPLTILNNARRLKKLIRQYNVDILHARSRAPAWSCFFAASGTPTKFMTTCHAPYHGKSALKKAYNAVMVKGEKVIAISHFVAQFLQKEYNLSASRMQVVPRGIALERFHPTAVTAERMIKISREWRLPDGAPVILLPGRLTRWKGHHVLLEAMTHLGRTDAICVIVGDDQGRTAYRKELEDYIREKKLEARLRLVDHCNDMPAAYMLATVVVSASIEPEGFGRVPVEGQAMGRPVVAADHGGAQETIVRGQTGWLVPPEDAVAMAAAIDEALALTPHQRAVLATQAMGHIAQNFTREKMTESTLQIYADLIRPYESAPQQDGAAMIAGKTGPFSSS